MKTKKIYKNLNVIDFFSVTVKLIYGVKIWNESYSKIENYTSFRFNNRPNIKTLYDVKHFMKSFTGNAFVSYKGRH